MFESKDMKYFVSIKYKQIKKQGENRIVAESFLTSFILVDSFLGEIDAVLHADRTNIPECRSLLSHFYDHTNYRQDNPKCNASFPICDEAMNNLAKLTFIKSSHLIPIRLDNIQFKLGDNVIVTENEPKGVHDRVVRIAVSSI